MRGQPIVNTDFSGGVNKDAAPYVLGSKQARDVLNITTGLVGNVKKRNGFYLLPAFVDLEDPEGIGDIVSLGTFERPNTKKLIAFTDDGSNRSIYSISQTGENTLISSGGLSPNRIWASKQAVTSGGQGPIYMVNGLDTPLYWDGVGLASAWTASSGSVPNGKYMIYHNNRLLVAGVETDLTTRSTLYASKIGDPRAWAPPDGVTNVFDPDDGEDISGLGIVGPYTLVFKPRKIYVVFDTDTLGYRKLSEEKGCVAHKSIINTDQGTFFLTSDRTVAVTDGSSLNTVSEAVDPLLKQIPPGLVSKATAHYLNDRYYLSISLGNLTNDVILEFDTRTSSWWIHRIQRSATTSSGATDWAILDPSGQPTLYASSDNRIFEAFKPGQFTDSNLEFPAYWTTGWEAYSEPHIRKIVTQVRADVKGEIELSFAKSFGAAFTEDEDSIWESAGGSDTEFGGTGTFGGDGIFGDSLGVAEHRWYTLGAARAWSFKFYNQSAADWELYSYTTAIEARTD